MISKAKPIFMVEIPFGQDIPKIRKSLESRLYDYHVILFSSNRNEIKFNAFYAKDLNEVKFNELKEIVKYAVK